MKTYKLTAYESKGNVIIDESLLAATDEDAIEKGQIILEGKELLETTHRLASPSGKLLLFHS
ncbi:YhzD family protein [Sporosarcina sp. 6E9]|uniref:YhzD family protein n=1 Tax=Sporosarcina sp. 6E9 TaxID=2819235 RepID=UPI001B30C3EC|nr:YhzD family protein [Sporosarcina sp. 6E9]